MVYRPSPILRIILLGATELNHFERYLLPAIWKIVIKPRSMVLFSLPHFSWRFYTRCVFDYSFKLTTNLYLLININEYEYIWAISLQLRAQLHNLRISLGRTVMFLNRNKILKILLFLSSFSQTTAEFSAGCTKLWNQVTCKGTRRMEICTSAESVLEKQKEGGKYFVRLKLSFIF